MEETPHFVDMLRERSIAREWVERAVGDPDRVEHREDGTSHFLKRIPENGERWLRVVVNVNTEPNLAVTAFFDRRLRRDA